MVQLTACASNKACKDFITNFCAKNIFAMALFGLEMKITTQVAELWSLFA